MAAHNLFTDYLSLIGVPHTYNFSTKRFRTYPPKLALDAVSDLLYEYHCDRTEIRHPADKEAALATMKLPFVVQFDGNSYGIVTDMTADKVDYFAKGHIPKSISRADFLKKWTGHAVYGTKNQESGEPEVTQHRIKDFILKMQKWALAALLLFLAVWCFIEHKIYTSWTETVLLALYGFGLYISYLLVLKSSNVANSTADSICSLLQPKGCNTVLKTDAAKLFGVFSWSDVGLTYYGVSIVALLMFPSIINYLAALSVCCLPYTIWSVLYQKFKAKAWCTMCLTIQCLQWVIFAFMLAGDHFHNIFPLQWPLFLLLAVYAVALIVTNNFVPVIFKYEQLEAKEIQESDDSQADSASGDASGASHI